MPFYLLKNFSPLIGKLKPNQTTWNWRKMNVWEKPRDLSWPSMKPRHGLLQFRKFVVLHNLLDREIIESLILIFFVSTFSWTCLALCTWEIRESLLGQVNKTVVYAEKPISFSPDSVQNGAVTFHNRMRSKLSLRIEENINS